MKRESNKHMYHYCSTRTAYEILRGKTLRMSDITKSNDYDEIYMFFPGILQAIQDQYIASPFDFDYENRCGENAIGLLLSREHKMIEKLFHAGGLTEPNEVLFTELV